MPVPQPSSSVDEIQMLNIYYLFFCCLHSHLLRAFLFSFSLSSFFASMKMATLKPKSIWLITSYFKQHKSEYIYILLDESHEHKQIIFHFLNANRDYNWVEVQAQKPKKANSLFRREVEMVISCWFSFASAVINIFWFRLVDLYSFTFCYGLATWDKHNETNKGKPNRN